MQTIETLRDFQIFWERKAYVNRLGGLEPSRLILTKPCAHKHNHFHICECPVTVWLAHATVIDTYHHTPTRTTTCTWPQGKGQCTFNVKEPDFRQQILNLVSCYVALSQHKRIQLQPLLLCNLCIGYEFYSQYDARQINEIIDIRFILYHSCTNLSSYLMQNASSTTTNKHLVMSLSLDKICSHMQNGKHLRLDFLHRRVPSASAHLLMHPPF